MAELCNTCITCGGCAYLEVVPGIRDRKPYPIEQYAPRVQLHVLTVQRIIVALHHPLGVHGCQRREERAQNAE